MLNLVPIWGPTWVGFAPLSSRNRDRHPSSLPLPTGLNRKVVLIRVTPSDDSVIVPRVLFPVTYDFSGVRWSQGLSQVNGPDTSSGERVRSWGGRPEGTGLTGRKLEEDA